MSRPDRSPIRTDHTLKVPLLFGWWLQLTVIRRSYWGVAFGARVRDPRVGVYGEQYLGGIYGSLLWWGFGFHLHGPGDGS